MAGEQRNSNLFEAGRNCWRIEPASRAAFLIDADAYFKAFVAAARNAQRSILIIGWDFHSRTRLLCDEGGECDLELGPFLNDLVRRKRHLHVHVLVWDFPIIYGLDREWAPLYGLGWKPRRRVHFRYDNTQPVAASHHQKIVVIDDQVAFCGGIDLTCRRWDTCAHAPNDQRRTMLGTPYPPFHDMAMMVEGAAAKALGDLARERWQRATGHAVEVPARHSDPWPSAVEPQLRDVEVAVARTSPPTNTEPAVREVEALYLDMIASARRCIYIENQYLTADSVGDALASRLSEAEGPEVIVVLRELSHGWLEEVTMQTLRTRLIEKLRAADRHRRLRIVYPYVQGLKEGTCIDVHAKLMIVDDTCVRIGSANLANRSMGLDTECDVAVAANDRQDVSEAIRQLRCELMAEHLGAQAADVQNAVERTGTLSGAIDLLQRPDRTLKELTSLPQVPEAVLNVASVADPERPVELNDLMKIFNSDVAAAQAGPAWGKIAIGVCAVLGLMALWKFTPLSHLLQPTRVMDWARSIGGLWWAPIVTMLAYTPAAFTMFPRPLITLFAVVAFGPWRGFLFAMLGIELAAWISFQAGRGLQRSTVRRVAGAKLNEMIQVLRRRGLLATTALRLVPLAPFAVEGVVAGAVRVRLRDFMIGTALGIAPGTLTSTVFGHQIEAALEHPSQVNYWLIGSAVALLVCATLIVRRWLVRASSQNKSEELSSARAA
ncbi:MAG TPA: VTT domain-containing protein [Steroidobacteraceae bacterium]|nr:VTT domain-containing protein [Steroidobacteraceae bacterium]